MIKKSWSSFALAALSFGCGSAQNAGHSSPLVGESLSASTSASDESRAPPAKPTPNPTLSEGATEATAFAYEYLLASADLALGDECGVELGSTSTWQALSILVRDRRAAMLWDLTARANAPEARTAAVIGLAKLRAISYADARDLLRHVRGTVAICKGATRSRTTPELAGELLTHRLDGESNEVAMP